MSKDTNSTLSPTAGGGRIDRRRLLALTGAGATSLLAGCAGGDDDEDDNGGNGSENGDDPLVATEFTDMWLGTEQDIQFNRHNITLEPDQFVTHPVFVTLIAHSRQTGEYYPVGIRDYSIDDDEIRIETLDDLTWHDGSPVTSEDIARVYKLNVYMELTLHDYVESGEDVYADGDDVVIELDDVYNPLGVETALAEDLIDAPEESFAEYVEQFEDAGSDEEIEEVQTELAQFNWREIEPHANGPFELENIDNQGMHFAKYDDYPWAEIQQNLEENWDVDLSEFPDELNFDRFMTQFFGDRQGAAQAALSGDLHGGGGIEIDSYDELENEFPDYANYIPLTSGWNDAFVYNMIDGENADMWRDRRVRQAFMHILDFEGINQQYSGDWGTYDRRATGMTPPMEEALDDEEFLDSLTVYKEDHDRAAELLEDAGLTEEDGEWYKPDGEQFEVIWSAPSTVQWQVDGMEYAASNLTQFGIESNVEVIEGTTYFGQTIPNMEYDLARGFVGNFSTVNGWELTWLRYDGADEGEVDFADYVQEPYGEAGLEVPPIGEPDSDDTIEIDPVARFRDLQAETDEEEINQIQRELSWAFNQTVPKIPGSAGAYSWYITDHWNYPDEDEHPFGLLQPLIPTLIQVGAISAKTESDFEY